MLSGGVIPGSFSLRLLLGIFCSGIIGFRLYAWVEESLLFTEARRYG
jgi:hypothetical protein